VGPFTLISPSDRMHRNGKESERTLGKDKTKTQARKLNFVLYFCTKYQDNKQQCSVKHNNHIVCYLLTLGDMFRFPWNHHQALSKKIQIRYIELLKHVMGSQTFTKNLCSQYISLFSYYSILVWISRSKSKKTKTYVS